MTTPPDTPMPTDLVPQCQEDIQKLLMSLRNLGAASELQNWSGELDHAYNTALDGIIALDLHLRVYSRSRDKMTGVSEESTTQGD